jgi:hypothetical protein
MSRETRAEARRAARVFEAFSEEGIGITLDILVEPAPPGVVEER